MKILVTGGSGFIGSYLKDHLQHEIIAPSSSELNLLEADEVVDYLATHKFDAVVHCAVVGRNNVYETNDEIAAKNLLMFCNLELGKKYYKKFINFGSGAEFGLDQDIELAYEDTVQYCEPKESYGFSKNLIAKCILKASKKFYNLRLFGCIDPSEGDNRLITKFRNTVKEGRKFIIDSDRYIDFFTLEDVTTVVEAVLDGRITDKDINLVYPVKMMTSDVLAKYCKVKNIDPGLIVVTGYGKNYTGDGNRLGKYNLNLAGLEATFERYED